MQRLILPIPPSLNHSHINIRRGNRLMRIRSTATKDFMCEAGWMAKGWCAAMNWTPPTKDRKIILRMWVWFPDKRKRDSDNILKILQDSLTGIMWLDDRQVLPRVMDVGVDKENPRVELNVEVMTDDAAARSSGPG